MAKMASTEAAAASGRRRRASVLTRQRRNLFIAYVTFCNVLWLASCVPRGACLAACKRAQPSLLLSARRFTRALR
jgi:hypothetical protein